MSADFWDIVRREVRRLIRAEVADPRIATVTDVDTGTITGLFAARVKLLPEGTQTGWLPIQSSWIGNGWGVLAVPKVGAQVYVSFQENNRSVGSITGFHYDTTNPPPQGAQQGELWMIHETGSAFKMLASGDVSLASADGQKLMLSSDTEVDVGDSTQDLTTFVLSTCQDAINNHKHRVLGVMAGGATLETSTPEDTLISDDDLTTVAKAN